jgi:hypothetical protein
MDKVITIRETITYMQSNCLTHRDKSTLLAMLHDFVKTVCYETQRLEQQDGAYKLAINTIKDQISKDAFKVLQGAIDETLPF